MRLKKVQETVATSVFVVKCEWQKDEGSVVILTAQVDGKEDKNMTAFSN